MSRFIFIAIIFLALLLRAINLNYNSPFNDEAIYVVVGTEGLFKIDWENLDAVTWMAGSPYTYPVVTAIAYKIGGLEFSRFINVLFGMGTIYLAGETAALFQKKRQKLPTALVTVAIVALLPISFYISRLATYDIPSFMFIFLGLYFLFRNMKDKEPKNELYMLSSVAFFISFLFKYLAVIYVLYACLVSLLYLKKLKFKNLFKNGWFSYFIIPILLMFGFYTVTNLSNLYTYITTESTLEILDIPTKIQMFVNEYLLIAPLALISFLYLIFSKKVKTAVSFIMGTLFVLVFHFVYPGAPSYDKHIFLSGVFMSIPIGIALPLIYEKINIGKRAKSFLRGNFIGFLLFMLIYLFSVMPTINNKWLNLGQSLNFLNGRVKKGDTVLTESGDAFVLALYEKINPVYTVTFDYINYLENEKSNEGSNIYTRAVEDGYFNFIELENQNIPKLERSKELNSLISEIIEENYHEIYNEKGVKIYERRF